MDVKTFILMLAIYLTEYFPEQMDQSLKPIDSAGCIPCRYIKFDFIIVGAGAAGCVLAGRLSENPKWKVLLIEAGDDEDYITDTPSMTASYFHSSKYDWNYTTVPQKHMCFATNKTCKFLRGHVMGGSSTLNSLLHGRGSHDYYDNLEKLGIQGWSYKDVLPYFLKSENMTIPELMDSPYHSTKGPYSVGYSNYNNTLLRDLLQAGVELGLPVTDYNGASQYGVAYNQMAIANGVTRCSTSKAYIQPVRDRSNLYIFKNTLAIKVLFSEGGGKKAIGVRCVTNGEEYNVYASKEVIISAGAFNTPKLLMLSGVGPWKHLEEMGIPVFQNLPVGNTLRDHPGVPINYALNATELNFSDIEAMNQIEEYAKHKTGIVSAGKLQLSLFLNSTTMNTDIHTFVCLNVNGLMEKLVPGVLLYIGNLKATSAGTVRLKSKDYLDPPLIDPNYMADASDIKPIISGLRTAMKYMETKVLTKYSPVLIKEHSSRCNYSEPLSDQALECIIRMNNMVSYHPTGTANIGSRPDNAVVDSSLKVFGIDKLRVVDASVFPLCPTGPTNGPTIMVAEKAAQLIKMSH